MQSGVGTAGGAWIRRALGAVLVAGIVASSMASAARTPRPLDYHATILNGRVTGSSFLISDGVAVTNAHVLNGKRPGQSVTLRPGTRGGNQKATILAVSRRMDLAVLRVADGVLPVVPREARRVGAGQGLIAAGVSTRHGRPGRRMELPGTVVSGRRTIPAYGPGLVARIPGVHRGFSGGPVVDTRGRLVGMLTALRPQAGSTSVGNEAFILSASEVRKEARRLLRGVGA